MRYCVKVACCLAGSAALLAVSVAFGTSAVSAQADHSMSTVYLGYVNLGLGFMSSDYVSKVSDNDVLTKNSQGGWGYSANAGYYLGRDISCEAGFIYAPVATYVNNAGEGDGYDFRSWLSYLSAVYSVPLGNELSVVSKAGVGYRYIDNHLNGEQTGYQFSPVVSLGLVYNVSERVIASMDYTFMPQNSSESKPQNNVPAMNYISFSLGYHL